MDSMGRIIKGVMVGCFILAAIIMIFLSSGCATGPRTEKEMRPYLPSRDADPRVGLVIVEGEPSAVIEFYDEAGRLVQEWSEAGTEPWFKVNGATRVRVYQHRLDFGRYRIKIRPYFYTANLFIKRRLVELRVRSGYVRVDRRVDTYDRYTGRYWGWVERINTGTIPRGAYSAPDVDITGRGFPAYLLEKIFGR